MSQQPEQQANIQGRIKHRALATGRLFDEELSLRVPGHMCVHTHTVVFSGPAWAVGIVMTILRRQSPRWPLVLIQPDFSAEQSSFLATNCAPTYGKREIPCVGEPEQSRADFTVTCANRWELFTQRRHSLSCYTARSGFRLKLLRCKFLGYWLPADSYVCRAPAPWQRCRVEAGSWHTAHPAGAGPLLPPGWLWGTSPSTTAELTHR